VLNSVWLNRVMEELPRPEAPSAMDEVRAERLAALAARRMTTSRAAGESNESASPVPGPTQRSSSSGRIPQRRHPAKGARAAALGLSLASTGGLAALFAVTSAHGGTELQAATVVSNTPVAGSTGAAQPQGINLEVPPVGAPAAPSGTPAIATDVVVDGGVYHNKWGDVQVRATFASDGSLTDVTTLQTPYRDGKSVRINDRAVPRLNVEALTAQSANVDTVSGATYTSNDYRRSLQSAIDAAARAGVAVAGAGAGA